MSDMLQITDHTLPPAGRAAGAKWNFHRRPPRGQEPTSRESDWRSWLVSDVCVKWIIHGDPDPWGDARAGHGQGPSMLPLLTGL